MGQIRIDDNPTPATDGVTVTFFVFTAYKPGTLEVFLDTTKLKSSLDNGFFESNPAAGEFTMKVAPLPGKELACVFEDETLGENPNPITLRGVIAASQPLSGTISGPIGLRGEVTPEEALRGVLSDVSPVSGDLSPSIQLSGTLCLCE